MEKLNKFKSLPHKILFYFGFIVVLIFLSLSYWQLNRYQMNKTITYEKENQMNIQIHQINELEASSFIKLEGTYTLVDYYKLRSRVHNGMSGLNVIAIYKNQDNLYLAVNHGWISLDNNNFKIGDFNYGFEGYLLNYDTKSPIGQDDVLQSDYIFRIDKFFLQTDQNIKLTNKYIHLSNNCGLGIECVELNTGYDPPHLSYSVQWLFFAICLSIVILRKNNFI